MIPGLDKLRHRITPGSSIRKERPMRLFLVTACVLYLVAQSAIPGAAQTVNVTGDGSVQSTPAVVGYGVGGVVGTILYAPLKSVFCLLGGVGSLVTLPFSTETAGNVASASCGGTWVITPAVVRGDEPVKFVGEPRP